MIRVKTTVCQESWVDIFIRILFLKIIIAYIFNFIIKAFTVSGQSQFGVYIPKASNFDLWQSGLQILKLYFLLVPSDLKLVNCNL